ncbi:G-protein coupled receptor 135-like [Tubulanus polymorphus]|uniref:G-protein coupled receptor 135-like n=1 Tax=Tubulanus polymorphus TaxID=672921 RepID=UPI003DA512B2
MSISSTTFVLELNASPAPSPQQQSNAGELGNIVGVVFKGVIVLFIMAFSCIGNLSVLIILWRNYQMRTITNGIIASLSVSDLFATTICMPLSAGAYLSRSWPIDHVPCIMNMVVLNLYLSSSTLTVALIALDRLFGITKIAKLTPSKAAACLVVIWLLSVFFAVPWTLVTYSSNGNSRFNHTTLVARCGKNLSRLLYPRHLNNTYFLSRMVICQTLPILMMLFSFFAILKTIRSSDKRIRPATTQVRNLLFIGEIRTATTVMIMIGVYLICLLPLLIAMFISALSADKEKTSTFLSVEITLMLVWSNCAINPIIYCTRNPNVATKFCFWRKRQRHGISVSHITSNRNGNHVIPFNEDSRSSVIFTEDIDTKIDLHRTVKPIQNGELADDLHRYSNCSGMQSEV